MQESEPWEPPHLICFICFQSFQKSSVLASNLFIANRGWKRPFDDPILVEGYADLLTLPPDDATRNVRAVRLKDQVETLRNLKRVGDVERRPRNGNVAD